AGFWIRIAASLLDILIVAIAGNMIPDRWQPNLLLIFAAYCCVLWATKGTTVGGIICGLKVVRLDERPIDWPTALVRALGGFLSLVAAGIGFIWVAFDDQKQSWHDKIAGTTIVHVPRGVSLV
ncbi:MAG TPA: RDD family protein, partial [Opitutus sp.]|nr:RDD family protein [Opitutus sp.]